MCSEEDKRIVKCVSDSPYEYSVLAQTKSRYADYDLVGLFIKYTKKDIVKEIPEDMLLIEMMKMQGE
jgi:hypothetical protein